MIRFENSNIVHIVPDNLKNDSVNAIGYAISNQVKKTMEYADSTAVVANIDGVKNEKLLDLLAIEMKVPYYNENFHFETKKEVIKKAILLQNKAGTDYAIESLIDSILGSGRVIPWYEYGGVPGYFKVESENQGVGVDLQEELLTMINDVKKKSAWLDSVEIVTDGNMSLNIFVKKDEVSFEVSQTIRIGGI